ncbi:MAG: dTDP-4-dehydrorhamnose 3,5-epimerase family protein [Actinobacteria bacterium]|nr:dTDP-4-dehydrorhamnose 3,5-epimerase family protein [Actinomycetota bacterium]
MEVSSTRVEGCHVVALEPSVDERGFFARVFDVEELASHGMVTDIAQMNMAHSSQRGTIRGVHWQTAPHTEAKLVRCIAGSVFDVCVDTRPDSPTLGVWFGIELSAENRLALYVPPGCGHVNQTLEPETTILYTASRPYVPGFEAGARWNDPMFEIEWPISDEVIVSAKDRSWPDWVPGPPPATTEDGRV